jgi:hypothetical protein
MAKEAITSIVTSTVHKDFEHLFPSFDVESKHFVPHGVQFSSDVVRFLSLSSKFQNHVRVSPSSNRYRLQIPCLYNSYGQACILIKSVIVQPLLGPLLFKFGHQILSVLLVIGDAILELDDGFFDCSLLVEVVGNELFKQDYARVVIVEFFEYLLSNVRVYSAVSLLI